MSLIPAADAVLLLALVALIYLLIRRRHCFTKMVVAMTLVTVIVSVISGAYAMVFGPGKRSRMESISLIVCEALKNTAQCGVTFQADGVEIRISSQAPMEETLVQLVTRRAKNLKPLVSKGSLTLKFQSRQTHDTAPTNGTPGSLGPTSDSYETYKTIAY